MREMLESSLQPVWWCGERHAVCALAAAHRPQRKRKRKVRYVLIETALVSGVGKRWTNFRTRVCEKSSFRDMRNLAYAVNSIPHVPAPQQPRLVISFVYKQQDDKRRMIVDNDVIQSLQERWPDAELGVHDYILEDADTQLAWLSRTSILVTNIGSPSFRLLYLPDGAQVRRTSPRACRAACFRAAWCRLRVWQRPPIYTRANTTPRPTCVSCVSNSEAAPAFEPSIWLPCLPAVAQRLECTGAADPHHAASWTGRPSILSYKCGCR